MCQKGRGSSSLCSCRLCLIWAYLLTEQRIYLTARCLPLVPILFWVSSKRTSHDVRQGSQAGVSDQKNTSLCVLMGSPFYPGSMFHETVQFSVTHLVNSDFLTTDFVAGTVLGSGDSAVSKFIQSPCYYEPGDR